MAEEFDEEHVGYDLQLEELTACVGVAKTMNLWRGAWDPTGESIHRNPQPVHMWKVVHKECPSVDAGDAGEVEAPGSGEACSQALYQSRALRNCQFHNPPIEASFNWFRLGALERKESNYIKSFYQSIAILLMTAQSCKKRRPIMSGLEDLLYVG